MAKKKGPSPGKPQDSSEVSAQVAALKRQADAAFLSKDFAKAIGGYEGAIKLLSDDAPEKSDLLVRLGGCFLLDKKYKEAIKAATNTLELSSSQPACLVALRTRAKAYEHLGFYKQALADAQTINTRGEGASDETREMERRIREHMSANKAKLGAAGGGGGAIATATTVGGGSGGIAAAAAAARQAEAARGNSIPYTITIRASLGDETRTVQVSLLVTYTQLYEAVQAKFPGSGPFVLKYVDKEGDSITLTSRQDIHALLSEMMEQYQRQMQGGAPKLGGLPPMRLQVVKVASEAEVPKPLDELPQTSSTNKEEQEADNHQEEGDDEGNWLLEFARTFTDVSGLDPAAHHENMNLANDKLTRAVEPTVSEERAQRLFEQAAEHYKDAACVSFVQWGNVHIVKADRQAQALLKAGKALDNKAVDAMMKEFEEAEKKFNEALKIKSECYEAIGSLGQLEWERAKAKLAYIVPAAPLEDPATSKDGDEVKEDAAAAVKEALAKLDPKKVGQVQKHIDSMGKLFEQALTLAKAAEEKKKAQEAEDKKAAGSQGEADAAGSAEATNPEASAEQPLQSPSSNMLVMHGNVLYEWSQVLAAVGKEWKGIVESAVSRFRDSGAAAADIRSALENHTRKEELDIPALVPEPEVVKPAAAPVKDEKAKAPAPEAKGLPSLEVKKKAAKA